MKRTPGPWSDNDDMIDVFDQANMVKDNIGTDREWQSVGVMDSEGMAEIVALCHPINAPLIAAAPEMRDFIMAFNRHVIKCARRGTNLDHYPEEWAPLKKQLGELVSKLT